MQKISRKKIVIHPFLFAIFPIIFLFSQNLYVKPEEIVLPLSMVIIVTIVIWIVLSFVLKSRIKSGFITSLGLIIFFSYGHIYILLNNLQKDVDFSHILLLTPTLILFGLGVYYFIKTKRHLNNATKIVNVISIALIMISFVTIGEYFITESYSSNEIENDHEKNVFQNIDTSKFPDVYYIIPDGYAGSESLQTLSNYDNSDFLDFLTKKGFHIASDSFSNYGGTRFSIPSTLNMKYLNHVFDESESIKKMDVELIEISRDNRVFKNFKSKGYTVYNIEAGGVHTIGMKNVDFRLCFSKDLTVTEYHSMLIRTTILNPIQGNLFSSTPREKILCGFSELEKMVERDDSPKFVFAHMMIPHQPYVFGPNGEPLIAKILTLKNEIDPINQDLYLGQLQFVNKKMEHVIEKLTETENPPIIIIQSDHGGRVFEYENEYENLLRWHNNFKAYYFPGEGRNIEFEKTTSVNSFRVLFNMLFDDEYELLEDRIFFPIIVDDQPKLMREVTDYLINNNSEN